MHSPTLQTFAASGIATVHVTPYRTPLSNLTTLVSHLFVDQEPSLRRCALLARLSPRCDLVCMLIAAVGGGHALGGKNEVEGRQYALSPSR